MFEGIVRRSRGRRWARLACAFAATIALGTAAARACEMPRTDDQTRQAIQRSLDLFASLSGNLIDQLGANAFWQPAAKLFDCYDILDSLRGPGKGWAMALTDTQPLLAKFRNTPNRPLRDMFGRSAIHLFRGHAYSVANDRAKANAEWTRSREEATSLIAALERLKGAPGTSDPKMINRALGFAYHIRGIAQTVLGDRAAGAGDEAKSRTALGTESALVFKLVKIRMERRAAQ